MRWLRCRLAAALSLPLSPSLPAALSRCCGVAAHSPREPWPDGARGAETESRLNSIKPMDEDFKSARFGCLGWVAERHREIKHSHSHLLAAAAARAARRKRSRSDKTPHLKPQLTIGEITARSTILFSHCFCGSAMRSGAVRALPAAAARLGAAACARRHQMAAPAHGWAALTAAGAVTPAPVVALKVLSTSISSRFVKVDVQRRGEKTAFRAPRPSLCSAEMGSCSKLS